MRFKELSPGYYNKNSLVFSYSSSSGLTNKNINITDEGLYYIYIECESSVNGLVGVSIKNSNNIEFVKNSVYGNDLSGLGVSIWLTPDIYTLSIDSGVSRVWCKVQKYIKN